MGDFKFTATRSSGLQVARLAAVSPFWAKFNIKECLKMRKQYRYAFEFKKTEEEARAFCERINAGLTRYMRKNKPAHFTPWSSKDGKENMFVCWYYV